MLLNVLFVKPNRCWRSDASKISNRALVRIPVVLVLNISFIDAASISSDITATGDCGALVRVECLAHALRLLHWFDIVLLRLDAICSLHIHISYLVAIVALVRHVGTRISIVIAKLCLANSLSLIVGRGGARGTCSSFWIKCHRLNVRILVYVCLDLLKILFRILVRWLELADRDWAVL